MPWVNILKTVVVPPNGKVEKHQCKIENRSRAKWSAADLDEGLLAAKAHLEANPNTRFVFVSTLI